MSRYLLLLLIVLLFGCRSAQKIGDGKLAQAVLTRQFIDLKPGWRILTITPLRKEPSRKVWEYAPLRPTREVQTGLNIEVELDRSIEFAYESSEFQVSRSGLNLRKSRLNVQGKEEALAAPIHGLFPQQILVARLRLLFLTRGSQTEYNAALIGHSNPSRIEALTQRLQENPASTCEAAAGELCIWIPAGIAVRPEMPDKAKGFVPAL